MSILDTTNKPILIAMMGLPRSGKSTIVEQLSKGLSAPTVRRDAIRLAVTGYRYLEYAEPTVKMISHYMVPSLFLAGHDIVICDETNYSQAARDALKNYSWDTFFYELTTSPEVCKQRAVDTGQPDLIPVIDGMFARYEPLGPEDERLEEIIYEDEEDTDGTITSTFKFVTSLRTRSLRRSTNS